MIAFSLRTFCCSCSLLISVNGKTYKSAIKRPIKIRTHLGVRNHTHRLANGRQAVRADGQVDERTDGQTDRFEQIRYPRIQLLSLSENEWESKRVLSNMIYLQKMT